MAGYSQDPLQYIRLIADNLRDRYESGFPVLKEIIQNADDAGSEAESIQPVHLDFGLTSGIPGAGHPLLKGPALYFINDGDFTEKDNRAIHSFGLNSKAAEEGSIGKFGLGMKSVFHFCEAFFFQAKGNESDEEYAEILNPWSSGSEDYERLHADWDVFSPEDAALMRKHLGGVLDWDNDNRKTCFLLWLPLRRREHLKIEGGQTAGSIIEAFPGDDLQQLAFLHETDLLAQRLAALFPLLRRLTRIRFWKKPTDPNPVFTVELDEGAERIRRNLEDTPNDGKLRGKIRINTADGPDLTTAFTGKQCLVEDSRLLDLKKSHLWPKSYTRDSKGRSQLAQDKTQAHSAAVFSFNQADSGTFITDWAVFLPVGGELSDTMECKGSNKTFRMTLHGFFFVDAGRAGIEGFPRKEGLAPPNEQPADETALRRLWNSHLARLGVFPLILPALKDFVDQSREKDAQIRLTDNDIRTLSQGLKDSKTFQDYQRDICAEHSWVCRLTREGSKWQCVGAEQELRVLPPPKTPKERERPWVTFPHLSDFEKRGVIFVEQDAPHLVARTVPQWNEQDLLEVLHIDAEKVFEHRVLLDYLTQFLGIGDTETGEIQERLQSIFRTAFQAHGSALSKNRTEVRAFVALIKPEYRYPLNAKDEVIQALQDTVTAKLLLNRDFDAQNKDNQGTAKFTPDETLALLHKLHELIVHEVDADTCRGIASKLVQAIPDNYDRRSVLFEARNLKILSGHDCKENKQVALSIIELEECRQRGLLFRFSAGTVAQQLNLAPTLKKAIQERVLVISGETFALVFGGGSEIVPCDAGAALTALGQYPPLSFHGNRAELIGVTANAVLGGYTTEQIRGLRYLLHGNPEHFNDETETLYVPDDGANSVWGEILAHLHQDAPHLWTLVDGQLGGCIARNNWNSLRLEPINPENFLHMACSHPQPSKFCPLMLEQLDKVNKPVDGLAEAAWLLGSDGQPVKPEDVIDLPEIAGEVAGLTAATENMFFTPADLSSDVSNHRNIALLQKHYFSRDRQGMEKLALMLERREAAAYRIGELDLADKTQEDAATIARICRDLPPNAQLRGWDLLAGVLSSPYREDWSLLTPALCRPVATEAITKILVALQQQHLAASKSEKRNILSCFNLYLAALAKQDDGKQALAGLNLLNRKDNWQDSGQLCVGAVGISDSHLLHEDHRRILGDVIVATNAFAQAAPATPAPEYQQALRTRLDRSKEALLSYLNQWRDIVPSVDMICVFLAVLGNNMQAEAARFSNRRHTLGKLQELIDRQWQRGPFTFNQLDFIITFFDGNQVEVTSILGEPISVSLQDQYTTLLVGGPSSYNQIQGDVTVEVTLRNPDPHQTSPADFSDYLRATTEDVLRVVYLQPQIDLSALWAELDNSDQLDIHVAQKGILKTLPTLFSLQLNSVVRGHAELQEVFKKWEKAQYSADEYEGKPQEKHYRREEERYVGEMERLALNDSGVQEAMLKAVRSKMEGYLYKPSRIPFELFQNADDAVVELLIMKCYPDPPPENDNGRLSDAARRFVLQQTPDCLYLAHWGRGINYFGFAPFPGRDRGYHRDLKKMLMLAASDKAEDSSVTGKFGLGFKSVFLVSAKPKLISRGLAAEIVGGMCPKYLEPAIAQQYRDRLQQLAPDEKSLGTLVALPLDRTAPQDMTDEFIDHAGLLCIFAKRIRRIDIDITGKGASGWHWQPDERICGGTTLEWGKTTVPGNQNVQRGVLYFRFAKGEGGILFGMGDNGFRPLGDNVPGIWAVAPTTYAPGIGLAVNANFDLDTGRTRLDDDYKGNIDKAEKLGRRFVLALGGLYTLDLPELRTWLHLADACTYYDFWHSLWRVLTVAVARAKESRHMLLERIVAGQNGFGDLLDRVDALPNGLWGDFQCLTRPNKITKVLKGVLTEKEFFLQICEWEFFRTFLGNPAELVADYIFKEGKTLVPRFGEHGYRVDHQQIDLRAIVQKFREENQNIKPEEASILGTLHDGLDKEKGTLEDILRTFLFKGKDGKFRESGKLLIASATNEEESRLAAFAPPDALLASEYQNDALSFFKLCRGGFRGVAIEDMTEWFLAADTFAKRCAALRYLRNGDHREPLAEKICKKKKESWVNELDETSQYFTGLNKYDIAYILDKLTSFEEKRAYRDAYNSINNTSTQNKEDDNAVNIDTDTDDEFYNFIDNLSVSNPNSTLLNIYNWWSKVRLYEIIEYENRIYPDPHKINLEDDEEEGIDRSSWLMLFMLGSLYTMGRQHEGQHREFLSKCIRKGWWRIFSKKNSDCGEWMGVLEDSFSDDEYRHWMNRFRDIYLFSRYLDIYRDIFLSIDKQPEISNLYNLLNPRQNPIFQGGGIDAPSIFRPLNFGVCFIIRELRRKNILKYDYADKFCYIPAKRIRKLFIKLHCLGIDYEQGDINDSKIIYEFICDNLEKEKADFCCCYDIPMHLLTLKKYRNTLQALIV